MGNKRFVVEFQPSGQKFEINPSEPPRGGIGEPGSILDMALGLNMDIDHACGGVSACSTCHVVVRAGLETCNESSEAEEDQLDKAPGLTPQSRLACQCIPNGSKNIVVEVPSWNRNRIREGN